MDTTFRIAWVFLSLATLLSWGLDASLTGTWVGAVVLFVAFFKARMVLMVFMEVSDGTPLLRRICEAWVLLAGSAVLGTYWLSPKLIQPETVAGF